MRAAILLRCRRCPPRRATVAVSALVLCAAGLLPSTAIAQASAVFKCKGARGEVVYSQTPCAEPVTQEMMKVAPAMRGGYPDYPTHGSARYPQEVHVQRSANRTQSEYESRMAEARAQQRQRVIAECERNRGVDCSREETIRYNESTAIPRSTPPRYRP
jgi:hypothetical protein